MAKAHVNGVDLYYEVHGQGEPVLLLSGLTADHLMFGFQLPALAPHFQCIVLDNRGVGQSDQPEGPYTIRQMADDAMALLDHLGLTRAHVVGASMGGAIAQEMALSHPDRVLSAAILCSWARGDEITARRLGVWAQAFQRFEPGDYVEYVFQLCFTHRLYDQAGALELFKQQSLANPFPQTPTGFQGQMAACSKHESLDRLGQIKAPTLVWAGAEDILLPPRFSRQIAERIQGAEYYEAPAAGHLFVYEQMESTGAKLLDWLQRVSQ